MNQPEPPMVERLPEDLQELRSRIQCVTMLGIAVVLLYVFSPVLAYVIFGNLGFANLTVDPLTWPIDRSLQWCCEHFDCVDAVVRWQSNLLNRFQFLF